VEEARLYVIPASHPSIAVELMLEAKGIDYKRTDFMPVFSKGLLRGLGFPRNTVPAMKLDGEKVQGTGEIARELDRLVPEPPIFPHDPGKAAKLEEVEAWGDDEFQSMARRTLWNALRRDRSPLRSYSEGAKLGIPIGLAVKTAAPIVAASARFNKASDTAVRADLAALPAALDKIDAWIADGVIGGDQPNIGDYQIAPSVRLLMTLDDLRPFIENRPAGKLAMRLAPDYPGNAPPILPPEWLEPIRSVA
jgi:glutathione S-transferase